MCVVGAQRAPAVSGSITSAAGMTLFPDLDDDALLKRLRAAAGADELEYHEQRTGDGWACSFRQFSVVPPGIAPRGPVVIATQGEELRDAREALLAQVEGESATD